MLDETDHFNMIYPYRNNFYIPSTVLEKCDTNKDDYISQVEFVDCYKEGNLTENLDEVFLELDSNKDGLISMQEIDVDAL